MDVTDVTADRAFYQCKSCETDKAADAFYVSNLSRCKECVKAAVRANRAANVDYYRAYDRKRYREDPARQENIQRARQSQAGIEARKRATARSKREEPHKWKARYAVANALRDGKITKGSSCYFCGVSERLHAHHEDYDHPLDVVWPCPACHGKLHAMRGDFRKANKEERREHE